MDVSTERLKLASDGPSPATFTPNSMSTEALKIKMFAEQID